MVPSIGDDADSVSTSNSEFEATPGESDIEETAQNLLKQPVVLDDKDVLANYESLSARRVDLIGDYAGSELFLIDGDSLLRHCFSDSRLDFQNGFQMLHATYLVEQFLEGLVRRKCNFHIAFFEQNRPLCVPTFADPSNHGKYLLMRTVLILHLETNLSQKLPSIRVLRFESTTQESFTRYLFVSAVYFVMCHDGASADAAVADGAADPETSVDTEHKIAYRAMIINFITCGYNVAVLNELEWRDTKAITVVLEKSRGSKSNTLIASKTPAVSKSDRLPEIDHILREAEKSTTVFALPVHQQLVVTALASILASSESPESLVGAANALLLHTAIKDHLPISSRCLEEPHADPNIDAFLGELALSLEALVRMPSISDKAVQDTGSLTDLVDGRLLHTLVDLPSTDLPFEVVDIMDKLWACVGELFAQASDLHTAGHADDVAHDGTHATNGTANGTSDGINATKKDQMSVLPFTNAVFDKRLERVHLSVDDNMKDRVSPSSARVFREVTHWHNSTRITDKKAAAVVSARDKAWALKRNQWFMAEMQNYAASLTSAVGKALDTETVIVGAAKQSTIMPPKDTSDTSSIDTKSSDKSAGKKGVKGGKNQTSKKQQILDSIAVEKAKKQGSVDDKIIDSWNSLCKSFADQKNLMARFASLTDYLTNLPKQKRDILASEVKLFQLETLIEAGCQQAAPDLRLVALIWNAVRDVARTPATKSVLDRLARIIDVLQLPAIELPAAELDDRKLPFAQVSSVSLSKYPKSNLSPKDFQLQLCGPYLDRSIDSAPDSRVDFEPDGWQRKVLDGIDANRSLFVVAPTSAGKTFISFYAMRKVLQMDNDGVLVYVAPTKALVNQIAAEIQARYRKSYAHGGKSVWAIHTRDYRINNPTGCQVLVTVPHVLQIMLLAPSNANSWSKRVKRIIFDEIHSIGNTDDGIVWEQLLLLAPCPIIALSATVGNPQDFASWLRSTQESIGNELEMVQHPYRYSDLRNFFYTPPEKFSFSGLGPKANFGGLGLDNTPGFGFVHPVASLANRNSGIPEDLRLEPRDCLALWAAMDKRSTRDHAVPESLDPRKALPKQIRKIDVLNWEKELKSILSTWIADQSSPFESVVEELSGSLRGNNAEPIYAPKEEAQSDPVSVDSNTVLQTTMPLLCRLHEQDALPAILFNYDREQCERICEAIMTTFESSEEAWKTNSTRWQTRVSEWEQWKARKEKLGSQQAKSAKSAAKKSKGNREEDDGGTNKNDPDELASGADVKYELFDPEAPVDGFHFADTKRLLPSELAIYVRQLQKRQLSPMLVSALKRGVGVHHAGMNRKYRQIVEMLFRKGFLRVVIATGTLALGINMPCKTVVFSGDSVFLTALNYRQAAGRAGRRGFDLLGNVVFQNISEAKVFRLLSSRLPDLNGHFPITSTLILRLLTLLHDSNNAPYAIKAINSLLSQPRLYLGGPEFKDQTLHHLRFSIEYLRRQHLLNSHGASLNFAGLVSHLYFTENSSFAFHALLKEGFFHRLCSNINKNEQDTLESLMLVMSHLFGRIYCRQSSDEFREVVIKKSSSVVFLPPLPDDAVKILLRHSDETLDIFRTYVRTFVDQHVSDSDNKLPLTGLEVGATKKDDELQRTMEKCIGEHILPAPTIRSSFVALSGHTDEFTSVQDLCATVRSGVFLEASSIPTVPIYPQEQRTPLNAYLLDFYKHGDVHAIERGNRIRKGEIWFLLNDFSLVLATITTSLMNFLKLKNVDDMEFLDVVGDMDEIIEAQDEVVADAEIAEGDGEVKAKEIKKGISTSAAKKKGKKLDSWEDASSEDEDDALEAEEEERLDKKMEGIDLGDAAWDGAAGEAGLMDVLRAFQKLRFEFNAKFRAMWA